MAIVSSVVNGPALLTTGTGSTYSLESLGYSEDGVEIDLTFNTEDMNNDIFGKTAWDVQYMLAEATIKATLVTYDTTVAAKVKAFGFGLTEGTMAACGTMMSAQGLTFPLIVQAEPNTTGVFNAACIKFPNAYCTGWNEHRGTRFTKLQVTFRALPVQQVSASTGTILYTIACS